MKRGTPDHPKTKKFARLVCRGDIAKACGHLELLWHWAAQFARNGAVGSFDDEDIAEGARWTGDAARFVSGLLDCGFLDASLTFRLVIHDWQDHAEDSVHMALARAKAFFANGSAPKVSRLTGRERAEAEAWYSVHTAGADVHTPCTRREPLSAHAVGGPSLAKPSLALNKTPTESLPSANGGCDTAGKNQRQAKAAKRFTPPTIEEVSAYCNERGNQVDPVAFVNHYEARGWQFRSGQPMKDWRAAVRTWERNDWSKADGTTGTHRSSTGRRSGGDVGTRGRVRERDYSHLDGPAPGAAPAKNQGEAGAGPLFPAG